MREYGEDKRVRYLDKSEAGTMTRSGFIAQEVEMMARVQLKPRLIFWRCVDLLIREKVRLQGKPGTIKAMMAQNLSRHHHAFVK